LRGSLGEIVRRPTAGTNGNINPFTDAVVFRTIDSKHLPEDPKVLQKMVLDLMTQLDRESTERHKIEAAGFGASGHRSAERDHRTSIWSVDFQSATDFPGTHPDARQTVTGTLLFQLKSATVLWNHQPKRMMFNAQLYVRPGAGRVAHSIVDAFLEDQKDLPSEFRPKTQTPAVVGSLKGELNIAGHEHLTGKLSHAPDQIVEAVFLRVDSPDDIAHGVHQFSRDGSDAREVFLSFSAPSDLAQDSDLGEARTDVGLLHGSGRCTCRSGNSAGGCPHNCARCRQTRPAN